MTFNRRTIAELIPHHSVAEKGRIRDELLGLSGISSMRRGSILSFYIEG